MTHTLLPPNRTQLEWALEQTASQQLDKIPRLIRTTNNPDHIPQEWLPWLAWAWRVENWDAQWSEEQKRRSIKHSYEIHRKKGTFGSVKAALDALGLGISVIEWFNDTPTQKPFSFKIVMDPQNVGLTSQDWKTVGAIIETTKNARSHLSGIDVAAHASSEVAHGAVSAFGMAVTLPASQNHPDAMTSHLSASTFGLSFNLTEHPHHD